MERRLIPYPSSISRVKRNRSITAWLGWQEYVQLRFYLFIYLPISLASVMFLFWEFVIASNVFKGSEERRTITPSLHRGSMRSPNFYPSQEMEII